MAESVTLKVEPETLISKADDINSEINAIDRELQGIGNIVSASTGYWTGDASGKHQKYYKEIQKDMGDIIKRLKEHPKDLLKMAKIYKEGEEKATEFANTLPKDVIS